MSNPARQLLDERVDAVDQTDDFVSGVVALAGGRLGGDTDEGPPRRRLGRLGAMFGLRHDYVAQGLAVAYGPERLRKASIEAARMSAALERLRPLSRRWWNSSTASTNSASRR